MLQRKIKFYVKLMNGLIMLAVTGTIFSLYKESISAVIMSLVTFTTSIYIKILLTKMLKILLEDEKID